MPVLVLDPDDQRRVKRERQLSRGDRFDEVWNGVYVLAPLPNNEHRYFAMQIGMAIREAVRVPRDGLLFLGVNVSDRRVTWKRNYRCPDIAVFLKGNPAKNCETHWFGGPDFGVEIVSPHDRSRDKLGFYASVGVRELLILDRKPWRLELYRLVNGALKLAATCSATKPSPVASNVLPFRFSLAAGKTRPVVLVTRTTDGHTSRI